MKIRSATAPWVIPWDHGVAEAQPLGGMLGPVWFVTPGGRRIQPFFVAPWANEPGVAALPGLLRGLRGEWPCVPFGVAHDQAPHGHAANHEWALLDRGDDWIEIGIDYPEGDPIKRLKRRIAGRAGSAVLDVQLEVEGRRDIDLGLALHPTFRLPDRAGAAQVDIAGLKRGVVYPVQRDASGRAMPGAWFERLDQVQGAGVATVDFSRLPFGEPNEDLLQIEAAGGRVRLLHLNEGWAARMEYDPGLFPSVILWVANRGWTHYPWSGRTCALGIEPARAAFDLGQSVSADPNNPLARAGLPTSVRLVAGERLRTAYALSVEDLP
jgi:hypothetical protein